MRGLRAASTPPLRDRCHGWHRFIKLDKKVLTHVRCVSLAATTRTIDPVPPQMYPRIINLTGCGGIGRPGDVMLARIVAPLALFVLIVAGTFTASGHVALAQTPAAAATAPLPPSQTHNCGAIQRTNAERTAKRASSDGERGQPSSFLAGCSFRQSARPCRSATTRAVVCRRCRIPGQRLDMAGDASVRATEIGAIPSLIHFLEKFASLAAKQRAGKASWSAIWPNRAADHRHPITPVTRPGWMSTSGSCRCRIAF